MAKTATKKAAPKKSAKAAKSAKSAKSASPVKSAKSAKAARPKSSSGSSEDQGPMLEKLFYDSLKDIYWAEKHLLKALPRLQKASTSQQLQQAFQQHTGITQEQVARLDQVFQIIGKKAQAKKCEAMDGLTKEAESIIQDTQKGSMTRDVGLIMAAQKVEHYEIAAYGGLAQLAKTMRLEDVKNLLGQTL